MLAAAVLSRRYGCTAFGFVVSALFLGVLTPAGLAEQDLIPSSPASSSMGWDGTSTVTIDELALHTGKIVELLDHASNRVERLVDEAKEDSKTQELVGAIRQELKLSRQWNQHLRSILLEVTEARRALDRREQRAAAEIHELTTVVEEARLELVALQKSLKPEEPATPAKLPSPEAGDRPQSKPANTESNVKAVVEALAGPNATILDARRTLEQVGDAQKTAAGDIEAVRAKIIDALHTIAPHRIAPNEIEIPRDDQVKGSLSSKEITAWAASTASQMHHEGYDDVEQARAIAGPAPIVEAMVMEGLALSTVAVRIAPDRHATAIAMVTRGSPVLVTGKVVDQDWYRVEIDRGRFGFVSGDLIKRQRAPIKPVRRLKS